MSDLKIKGKIVKILATENGTSKAGKAWQKQGFVVDTGAQYNPEICLSIFGADKVKTFNESNNVGDQVSVSFNLSSREHNDKYYHSVDAWKVESADNF